MKGFLKVFLTIEYRNNGGISEERSRVDATCDATGRRAGWRRCAARYRAISALGPGLLLALGGRAEHPFGKAMPAAQIQLDACTLEVRGCRALLYAELAGDSGQRVAQ